MIDFKKSVLFKLAPMETEKILQPINDFLLDDEKVFSAFKTVRDQLVFTDNRIIAANVQGITGKKVDYTSIPYSKIQTFSVETSPIPDDCEMYVELDGNYTRIERETTTTVSFYMDGSGQQDFSVFIGNIVPQAPDSLTSEGLYNSITLDWNEDGAERLRVIFSKGIPVE